MSSVRVPLVESRWFTLAVLFLIAVLSYTDRLVLNVLVEPIKSGLGLSDTQVSVVQGAAFAVIYSVAALPLGRLADTLRRRELLIACVLLWSAGTLLCGWSRSFGQLFASRLVVGLGESALFPAGTALLVQAFPPTQRARAIGIFFMGSAVGTGSSILAGGALLRAFTVSNLFPTAWHAQAWRWVLTSLSLGGLVLTGLLCFIREPARVTTGSPHRASITAMRVSISRLSPILVPLLLALMFQALADYGSTAWLPTLLVRKFGLSASGAALSLGPMDLAASVAGPLLGGVAADSLERAGLRRRKPWLSAGAFLLCVPVSFVCLDANSVFRTVLAYGALIVLMAVGVIAATVAIQDAVTDGARATAMASQSFAQTIVGLGVGPTAVALMNGSAWGQRGGLGDAILAVVVPALSLGALCAWLTRFPPASEPQG